MISSALAYASYRERLRSVSESDFHSGGESVVEEKSGEREEKCVVEEESGEREEKCYMLVKVMAQRLGPPDRQNAELVRSHLFVFLDHDYGQIASSLYMIDVPKLFPPSSNSSSSKIKKNYRINCLKEPKDITEPFIEFPYPDFPRNMCCVELKSKLYFLGGHFTKDNHVYNLLEGSFPCDIHVLHTPSASKKKMDSSIANNYILLKGEIPPMKTGKPFPYAFTTKDNIFIYDNSIRYMKHRPYKSLFEVYQRVNNKWKQLPDPPFPSTVCGHALSHDNKLFLSCEGVGTYGHVLCFDVNKHEWLQHFIQGFQEHHKFYGEAQLLNDTLYALSGFSGCIPAAYQFKSKLVQHFTGNLYKSVPFYMAVQDTDLFDSQALVAASMEGLSSQVFPDWLSSDLVYLGDPHRCFCYIRAGQFPNDEYPEYEGIVLSYFVPDPETFTEVRLGSNFNSFTGKLLHSSHLKIKSADPHKPASIKSCFFVPNKAHSCESDIKTPGSNLAENKVEEEALQSALSAKERVLDAICDDIFSFLV